MAECSGFEEDTDFSLSMVRYSQVSLQFSGANPSSGKLGLLEQSGPAMDLIRFQREFGVIPENLFLDPIEAVVAAWNSKVPAALDWIVHVAFPCPGFLMLPVVHDGLKGT